MNNPENRLPRRYQYGYWLGLVCLLVGYLVPYIETVNVPHFDYFRILPVINYIRSPELFSVNDLVGIHADFHLTVSPLYYYLLAYPISQIFSSKWALLTVGLCISWFCGYFAGRNWKTSTDALTAAILLFVLLQLRVSPLEGLQRSFTAFFVLGALWLGKTPDYRWMLFFTALAGGIYPPAAVVIMAYFGFLEVRSYLNTSRTFRNVTVRLTGIAGIFLVFVSPFLGQLLFSPGQSVTSSVPDFQYHLDSASGLFRTFIYGGSLDNRGALFRYKTGFNLFVLLLVCVLLQGYVLGRKLRFRLEYRLLIAASLGTWLLAHLVHPLIYQPVKYTRIALLVPLLFVFVENLPPLARSLRKTFARDPWLRRIFVGLALWQIGLLLLFSNALDFSELALSTGIAGFWWTVFFFGPIVFVVLFAVPSVTNQSLTRSFLAGFLLFGSIYLPPERPDGDYAVANIKQYVLEVDYGDFDGMHQYLRGTPPGTMVAGPYYQMNGVPSFALRSAYDASIWRHLPEGCDRIQKFWNIYFSDDPENIRGFMASNTIDYLLVDRAIFRSGKIIVTRQCIDSLSVGKQFYLNRPFPKAAWSYEGRYYLIHRSNI